jgi:hypothetical protein
MSNSPDVAFMDYTFNRIFKWQLSDDEVSTINGLKGIMTSVWAGLSLKMLISSLKSWQERVELMIEYNGFHIEHHWSGRNQLDE